MSPHPSSGGKPAVLISIGTIASLVVHGGLVVAIYAMPARVVDVKKVIELTDRELPRPKPKPKAQQPKQPKQPKPAPTPEPRPDPKPKTVVRRRPKVSPKPKAPEPEGKPESKTPAAPDTGAKTFGIDMEGSTAAPGTGVQVPKGQTLKQDPRVRRVGKGKPKAGKKGFKKTFKRGERAPVAVISSMPRVQKRVQAAYPERMRELGIEGRVVLQLTVGPDGRVTKTKVLKGLRKELDRAAIAAAKKMRFTPAKVGTIPVTVKIPYTFTFVLD
ncbi:MAG: hypothetical protein CSA65_07745 [Proteobacteria bacterium]|nr:MAG: hypothetical protein CSA65_07745 [Pseudomonadota bacterium]